MHLLVVAANIGRASLATHVLIDHEKCSSCQLILQLVCTRGKLGNLLTHNVLSSHLMLPMINRILIFTMHFQQSSQQCLLQASSLNKPRLKETAFNCILLVSLPSVMTL